MKDKLRFCEFSEASITILVILNEVKNLMDKEAPTQVLLNNYGNRLKIKKLGKMPDFH
jgi:hypothetical protein